MLRTIECREEIERASGRRHWRRPDRLSSRSPGSVQLVTSFRTAPVHRSQGGVYVAGVDGVVLGPFDEIIAATGFRPDLTLTQELRLDLDPTGVLTWTTDRTCRCGVRCRPGRFGSCLASWAFLS